MSLYDLIIRNGTLVTANRVVSASIAIANGQIVAIAPDLTGTSRTEIDATGLHIFPGLIDAHVHFNEPGRTDWEGFATGTQALAAGGATCFFDMPLNSSPPTLDQASFDLKVGAAQAAAQVDFALWGGLVPGDLDRLDELAASGVIGFKAFMSNSGIADFPSVDDMALYEGMGRAAKLGRIVAVHAENDQVTGLRMRRAIAHGKTSVRDYLESRPVIAEIEAIVRAILFAEETGCALHIVHVSCGRGVDLIVAAQSRGVDVSCETCPHYLVLTEEDVETLGAVAKCAPPLRTQNEQSALWAHLRNGTLPIIASDHSPAPVNMKTDTDFFKVWGGISGCQSTLPLLLTEGYFQRELPLLLIAAVTATNVAQRFRLSHRKGQIAVGADADLALIDLAAEGVLSADDLFYRHRHSPYVGKALRGQVVRTLVRGQTVFAQGKPVGDAIGQLIKP